jgi:hypothetical protein
MEQFSTVDIPAGTETYGNITIHANGRMGYIAGAKALVTFGSSKEMFGVPDQKPQLVEAVGTRKGQTVTDAKLVHWGSGNRFPSELREKVNPSVETSSNLLFNILTTFGEGIKPMMLIVVGNEKKFVDIEVYEITMLRMIAAETNEEVKKLLEADLKEFRQTSAEILTFFEENNMPRYYLEQCTDLHWFYNVFPAIGSNAETGEKRKIVKIKNKEATFSRWTEMNEKGQVPWHLYSAKWTEAGRKPEDVVATPVLDFHNPVADLRERWEEDKDKTFDNRDNYWIIPVTFPTPGRNYYARAYWYSMMESGLYDIAIAVPELRKAIVKNQTILNFMIYVHEDYFPEIFKRENITTEKDQKARIKLEYTKWETMLKGEGNAGKSLVVYKKKGLDGTAEKLLEIIPVDNKLKSSDHIDESEDISNSIAYAHLIHPSTVGAAPGKNKSINGTEARELFIIKQAMLDPFRQLMLQPFYVVKAINNWPKKLHFINPHKELTTLDNSKTGSVTKENN